MSYAHAKRKKAAKQGRKKKRAELASRGVTGIKRARKLTLRERTAVELSAQRQIIRRAGMLMLRLDVALEVLGDERNWAREGDAGPVFWIGEKDPFEIVREARKWRERVNIEAEDEAKVIDITPEPGRSGATAESSGGVDESDGGIHGGNPS